MTKPQAPIHETIKVKNIIFDTHDNKILTKLIFSNDTTLACCFEPTTDLTFKEKQGLLHLFKKTFSKLKANSNIDIHTAFNAAIRAEVGDYIKLIQDKQHHIVGAVIYRLRLIENSIRALIDFEYLDETYHGLGIMPIITYLPVIALQGLYTNEIIISFLAASYSAAQRLVKRSNNLLDSQVIHSPKYQPNLDDQNEQCLQKTVASLANQFSSPVDSYHFDREKLIFYVVENEQESVVVNSDIVNRFSHSKPLNLQTEYFNRFRGLETANNVDDRKPMYTIFFGYEFFLNLKMMAASKGIDLIPIFLLFACYLKASHLLDSFLLPNRDSNKKVILYSTEMLFWQGKKETKSALPSLSEAATATTFHSKV